MDGHEGTIMKNNWFSNFVSKYKAGISHTFLFNFNVYDYVDQKRELERYIWDEFLRERKFAIIASYDIAHGLTFPDEAMEREFRKIALNGAALPPTTLPSKIFPLLDMALSRTKMVLFIKYADLLVPSGGVSGMSGEERVSLTWLCEWSLNAKISAVGSLICMTAGNIAAVSTELQSSSFKVEPILVPLPDEEERLAYIKGQLEQKPVSLSISEQEFAMLSSGLTKKSIKDIMLKSEAEEEPVSFEFIKEKKHSVLQKEYGDVLEFIYPEIGFEDIGGMEAAKRYLQKNVITPVKKNDLRRVPMGVLLCGPSGTGKTLLVYALARASGFNCVKIDMARILGQYVGESEKNFKKCLLGALSQQPVIVFVDEIDTAFKRGDDRDSGVSRNIFSEFLQFTGNTKNRGKVIFIAATNRPDMLDPALKRAGRFDKKIPILIPNAEERAEVFKVIIKKYRFNTDLVNFKVFAEKTPGYTGAEIEVVLRKAYELACEEMEQEAESAATDGFVEAEAESTETITEDAADAADTAAVPDREEAADGIDAVNGMEAADHEEAAEGIESTDHEEAAQSTDEVGVTDKAVIKEIADTAAAKPAEEAVIRSRHLLTAIEKCLPNTGQIEFMTQLAIDECDDADFLV